MIANHAHSDGTGAFPNLETLARESRITTRQVSAILGILERSGELVIERGYGPRGSNLYSLPMQQHRLPLEKISSGKMQQSSSGNPRLRTSTEPSLTVLKENRHTPTAEPSAPGVCEIQPTAEASVEAETKEVAFSMFWEKWPRRQARADARRAWRKIPMAEYPVVMAALEKWLTSDQWKRGVIPHPATWLNEKRWQDEDIPQFGGINGTYTASGKPNASDLALRNARALGLDERPN
jgi:hypothetical protein